MLLLIRFKKEKKFKFHSSGAQQEIFEGKKLQEKNQRKVL